MADHITGMTRQQFLDQYVVSFLATWTALHYDDLCFRGLHERLARPPAEDALDLAEKAWGRYEEAITIG